MSEPEVAKNPDTPGLTDAQAESIAGGGLCSAEDLVNVTSSLIQAYENLVDFTSHVIGRVAGE